MACSAWSVRSSPSPTRVFGAALKGLVAAPSNPFVGGADQTGLPADFRRTGLADTSTLQRALSQRLGITPAAYRERFASQ